MNETTKTNKLRNSIEFNSKIDKIEVFYIILRGFEDILYEI